jgi:cation:H+ antiporter
MILLFSIISLIAGFIFIYLSADVFTDNSARIAKTYKISPLIIGIVILGFGTSAPEMLVAGWAAFVEHPGLSVGNAFGSNIINIALVLGITAIIQPIKVELKSIEKEWYFLIAFTLGAGLLLLVDRKLNTYDGYFLVAALVGFLLYTFRVSKKIDHDFESLPSTGDLSQKWKIWRNLVVSLTILLVCAQLIVFGGINIAAIYHVPDVIVGITIVALGTSIPELAVSITSAFKKQHKMVVGTIIGSNIFNTVAVLAIPALISTTDISLISTTNVSGIWPSYIAFFLDFGVMLFLTVGIGFFLFVTISGKKKNQISKSEGISFIVILCLYLVAMFFVLNI